MSQLELNAVNNVFQFIQNARSLFPWLNKEIVEINTDETVIQFGDEYQIAPIINEDELTWSVMHFRNDPGFFDPRDGGRAPETHETELGVFGTIDEVLVKITEHHMRDELSIVRENMLWDIIEREEQEQ